MADHFTTFEKIRVEYIKNFKYIKAIGYIVFVLMILLNFIDIICFFEYNSSFSSVKHLAGYIHDLIWPYDDVLEDAIYPGFTEFCVKAAEVMGRENFFEMSINKAITIFVAISLIPGAILKKTKKSVLCFIIIFPAMKFISFVVSPAFHSYY